MFVKTANTVKVVLLLTPPEMAVMVVTPFVKPVAKPLVVMAATLGLLLDQSKLLVTV